MLKEFFTTIVMLLLTINLTMAADIVITEEFDGVITNQSDTTCPETISADTIIDTNTNEKIYIKDKIIGNRETKLMTKALKLDTYPEVLPIGPYGERFGVLHTGKSNLITRGISEWYHFSGVVFDMGYSCQTLSISFSYLNNRSVPVGKVKIIVQEVDADGNVLWEDTWGITGYKDYIDGWEDITISASRYATRLAGRNFNRVWLVESELYLDSGTEGGYFDGVIITATTTDEVSEPLVVEEPPEPVVDRDITPPVEEVPEVEEPVEGPAPEVIVIVEKGKNRKEHKNNGNHYGHRHSYHWGYSFTNNVVDTITEEGLTVSNELIELLSLLDYRPEDWKNHSQYFKWVTQKRKELTNYYSTEALDAMVVIAANSSK